MRKSYRHQVRLIPAVGRSTPDFVFNNAGFSLTKAQLSEKEDERGNKSYPQWVIDLIWPKWKTDNSDFLRRDEALFQRIGIEYRFLSNKPPEDMGVSAINDLKIKLTKTHPDLINDPNKTGLIISTGAFVSPNAPLPLRSSQEEQLKALKTIAQQTNLRGVKVINEACSGFVAGIENAVETLGVREDLENIILLTLEKPSAKLDFSESKTSILFSDLATAMAITRNSVQGWQPIGGYYKHYNATTKTESGIIEPIVFNDDGSDTEGFPRIRMHGRPTFEHAVREMPNAIFKITRFLQIDHIDWLYGHQANQMILLKVAKSIQKRFGNVIAPIHMKEGNTSSSTIPNLINSILSTPDDIKRKIELMRQESLDRSIAPKHNDMVALLSFASGMHVRSIIMRYINS